MNEFFKNFPKFDATQFNMPQVDTSEVMEFYRKNMESFSAASKIANETAQTIARRNTDFLRENMETAMNASKDVMTTKTPDQNIKKQAELAKDTAEKGMSQIRDTAELATKSSMEVFDIMTKSFSDNLCNAEKMTKKKKAA